MANPTINELQNPREYKLIARLNHQQIKEFVINQIVDGGWFVKTFMIYQVVMILAGSFFFTKSIVLAFRDFHSPLVFSLAALVFCFSALIIFHELLHGIALKLIGAPRVSFGGYLKKFIFYAEADQFVINRKQFAFVALTPLVAVKLATVAGAIFFYDHPVFYFLIFVMSAHSLFCAGDIGLLSLFYKYGNAEIFTFDIQQEKTSYYYQKADNEFT